MGEHVVRTRLRRRVVRHSPTWKRRCRGGRRGPWLSQPSLAFLRASSSHQHAERAAAQGAAHTGWGYGRAYTCARDKRTHAVR